MKKFMHEFKEFAMRGNVIDLAVGVVIGGAFGKIVSSLVNNILTPLLGILLGGINFKHLQVVLKPATAEQPEVALQYGLFLQSVIDFVIIAFTIFMMIKLISRMKRQQDEVKPSEVPAPSKQELLLEEIRDLLKK